MSRTVIDVDDRLLKRVQSLTGLKRKADVVNYAVERLVHTREIRKLLELQGKIPRRTRR